MLWSSVVNSVEENSILLSNLNTLVAIRKAFLVEHSTVLRHVIFGYLLGSILHTGIFFI